MAIFAVTLLLELKVTFVLNQFRSASPSEVFQLVMTSTKTRLVTEKLSILRYF